MGRSSSAHARSAVSTSAGTLRTVSARQQRSPNDNAPPPPRERSAPASSASAALSGATVTPAALMQLAHARDIDFSVDKLADNFGQIRRAENGADDLSGDDAMHNHPLPTPRQG